MFFFFFKQKTAYEMRISDWSSDVCSSDLIRGDWDKISALPKKKDSPSTSSGRTVWGVWGIASRPELVEGLSLVCHPDTPSRDVDRVVVDVRREGIRAEEHTYELQTLMRISYAVC